MPKRESAKRVWLITHGTACPSITHEVCTEGWVEVDTSRDTNSKLRGLPIELCLLIAQTDPLVAIRLHAASRQFRRLINKNLISLTQNQFLPGLEGPNHRLPVYALSVKPLLRGLFFYFGKKMAAEHNNLQNDVDSLKHQIEHKKSKHPPTHVRSWILTLQDTKPISSDTRAYLMTILKAVRAYYGLLYLTMGNDTKGTRSYALSFLATAETVLASQFRATYHLRTKSYKITCNTKSFFAM